MLTSVAFEEYLWLDRVLVMLTHKGDYSVLAFVVKNCLEYQNQPADDTGGTGDDGHHVPLP